MCGIFGICSRQNVAERSFFEKWGEALKHRGPDDSGEWWSEDGRIGLGHRRLAVMDLSSAGHQPMISSDRNQVLVFNGEVYNFRELRADLEAKGYSFISDSDTEVLLIAYREWGTNFIQRLNGMFAFAIYDNLKKKLFIGRDRVGEKPLYYWHDNGQFMFSSELKGLFRNQQIPKKIDPHALDCYLAYGYVPGNMSILLGVNKLLPAHWIEYDLNQDSVVCQAYWKLPEYDPDFGKRFEEEEICGQLEELLFDSVERQLVADVPVGVMLSGGIDSSLVTAIASEVSTKKIMTFNVSFPGHSSYDESKYAKQIANYFGTDHHELTAESMSFELLPEMVRQFDEPFADHALMPTYLVTKLIRENATVAISGDGGDELFGGYPHYIWAKKQSRYRRIVPSFARSAISLFASSIIPPGARGRNHLIGLSGDEANSIAHINMYFDRNQRRHLLPKSRQLKGVGAFAESYRSSLCNKNSTPLMKCLEADFYSTLADGYLVKVDRASMLNSLEVRAPLLDYRIIEFAFRNVPEEMKIKGDARKIALCEIAKKKLPSNFDYNRKQGFTMPLHEWFKGEWGKYMESVLLGSNEPCFSKKKISEMINLQKKGYANINRLFALTVFQLWKDEYQVGF